MQIDSAEDHVAQILEEMNPGCMMTKFILIAEGIDTDGERGVYTVQNDGAMLWDNIGMLEFALAIAKGKLNGLYVVDERDDNGET